MSQFKTISVSISFEVSILQEESSKFHPIETVMEHVLDTIYPEIGRMGSGRNIAISSAAVTAEHDGKKATYRTTAQKMIEDSK